MRTAVLAALVAVLALGAFAWAQQQGTTPGAQQRPGAQDQTTMSERIVIPPASDMSEAMQQRRKMLLQSQIHVFAPASIIALSRELNLKPDQVDKIQKIAEDARTQARAVLDQEQLAKLNKLMDTPDTVEKLSKEGTSGAQGQSGTRRPGSM